MGADLRTTHAAYLDEVRDGRIRFELAARFHYLRDGQPVDHWDAVRFHELLLAGVIEHQDSGRPLVEVSQ